jgi:hypothetical protein
MVSRGRALVSDWPAQTKPVAPSLTPCIRLRSRQGTLPNTDPGDRACACSIPQSRSLRQASPSYRLTFRHSSTKVPVPDKGQGLRQSRPRLSPLGRRRQV